MANETQVPTKVVVISAPEGKNGKVIQHDCSGFPNEPIFNQFKLTTPYLFWDGDEVELPLDVADYFIRAGWAAEPGKDVVKPDPTKPVFVQPDNGVLGVRDTNLPVRKAVTEEVNDG